MARKNEFPLSVKRAALTRQQGVCAFCGTALKTKWSEGEYQGYGHHLRPIWHGGSAALENCVYLCWGHHLLIGHGMAPFGIDAQGGSSETWVDMQPDDFAYWHGDPET